MFGRPYASQSDVDDCPSRIVTLNDIVTTNPPRVATLESKLGHVSAEQETMQKRLDREIQQRNLLSEQDAGSDNMHDDFAWFLSDSLCLHFGSHRGRGLMLAPLHVVNDDTSCHQRRHNLRVNLSACYLYITKI